MERAQKLLSRLPFLVVLAGIGALAMLVPALHAIIVDDERTARSFLYAALLFLFLTAGIGLAASNRRPGDPARTYLLALLGAYVLLPAMMAVPVREVVQDTTFFNAYLEMLSAFTTTGGSVFSDPDRLPISVHLWRALVGWMGGLLVWISAVAVLAPLRLGGFEVLEHARFGVHAKQQHMEGEAPYAVRLMRFAAILTPIYLFLTLNLWLLLLIAGAEPTHGAIHAMSTISTSGITALSEPLGTQGGFAAECVVFFFLFFAVSRQTFAADLHREQVIRLIEDRELRLAILACVSITTLLFLRHWWGALDVDEVRDGAGALSAMWGSVFTVLSFLTTTGFESADWAAAQRWSGLNTPGILLLGLAMFGGGVATTAGGVKLLRVYALYKHGRREMDLLVHPNAVAGPAQTSKLVSQAGAQAAWIFFMLFALSVAGLAILFSLTGLPFEEALVATIAGLSTTGPLLEHAPREAIELVFLSDAAKAIYAVAMVLGRLEALALIALFNPEFWR